MKNSLYTPEDIREFRAKTYERNGLSENPELSSEFSIYDIATEKQLVHVECVIMD